MLYFIFGILFGFFVGFFALRYSIRKSGAGELKICRETCPYYQRVEGVNND